MAYGLSNGHVTDDVTWPLKVLWGSTVSYPSDTLASCCSGRLGVYRHCVVNKHLVSTLPVKSTDTTLAEFTTLQCHYNCYRLATLCRDVAVRRRSASHRWLSCLCRRTMHTRNDGFRRKAVSNRIARLQLSSVKFVVSLTTRWCITVTCVMCGVCTCHRWCSICVRHRQHL